MKYTVVKQFSNAVIDNLFTFIFKWVDFGKMFIEFLWSFLEIWIAFFMIFYNAFMYVYYLFLFFIDRGAESSAGMFRLRGLYTKTSSIPKVEISKGPNVIPPMYGKPITSAPSPSAASSFTSLRSSGPTPTRRNLWREILEGLAGFFKMLGRGILYPFKKLVLLFDRTAEARKQREEDRGESKSLIDEYIKEYERRRR